MTTHAVQARSDLHERVLAQPAIDVLFLLTILTVTFHKLQWELAGSLTHADRVYIVNAGGQGSPRYAAYLARLGLTLTHEGFVHERTDQLGRAHVDQWRRRPAD